MPSSLRLRLTPEAEADLREILQYSGETWGAAQRRSYAATLDASLRRRAEFPGIGKDRSDLAVRLRSHVVGQHVIFYRAGDTEIVVERVLHQARDVGGGFGEAFP